MISSHWHHVALLGRAPHRGVLPETIDWSATYGFILKRNSLTHTQTEWIAWHRELLRLVRKARQTSLRRALAVIQSTFCRAAIEIGSISRLEGNPLD
eukprot:COSAG02_NODE_45750_length_354_cov_0.956863_1_plen_96_part_10